jgi:ATP/maltotriose-dependent transcriptional regulator MalT
MSGRLTEAELALKQVPLDHPTDTHSTVLARLELERAALLVRTGKHAEARSACGRALKTAHFTFVDLIKVWAHCLEAEAWLAAGEPERAREPAEQAVGEADATGCPRALALALVTRGAVALVRMDLSQAGADFNRAISVVPAEDVGLTGVARAWTGGVLLVGGHPESANALLGRATPQGDDPCPELSVLIQAWNARTAMVMGDSQQAEQALRLAREGLERSGDALLPSIRRVFEEAEVVVGKTGVFRHSSSAAKPRALR